MEKIYNCMMCGKEIDYEPKFCCNGSDCGCGGLPIDPPLCDDCWDMYMSPMWDKNYKCE